MSTSRPRTPLRERIGARLSAWRGSLTGASTNIAASTDLPDLLIRLGRRYVPIARRQGVLLELDTDPALATDLTGPFAGLGHILSLLLDRAIAVAGDGYVALQVDVVGDDDGVQLLHFTIADDGDTVDPDGALLDEASASLAALGGILHCESGEGTGTRVIVELAFTLPRHPPLIDVDGLRATLGGEHALREVIVALDHTLSRDLADLEVLLDQPGANDLQAWLHRVSGALGMAEATHLARTGLSLERDLAHGRDAAVDAAIRRFGADASHVLEALREHA